MGDYTISEVKEYFEALRDARQKILPAEDAKKDMKMFNQALHALRYQDSHESHWDGDYYGEDC